MKKLRYELIGIVLIFSIAIFLFLKKIYNEKKLSEGSIFVVGRLISSSFGSDHGWMYEYEYLYKGKKYLRSFSGPVTKEILNDSLLFFRILSQNPKICRQVEDIRVPKCVNYYTMPEEGWNILPTCNE